MTSYLIAGPGEEPVSLAEAKAFCRIEHADEDSLMGALIAAARLHVESATGRALVTQSWRLVLRGVKALVVPLPVVPVASLIDAPVPYIVIARHDLVPRDGDGAPGHEHRLLLHVWAAEASRKAVLATADEMLAHTLGLESELLKITLRRHDRTDTAIDTKTGRARAAVSLTFFTEPN